MADGSRAKANLRRRARRAHERAMRDMRQQLQRAAPKDTRQLERSIRVSASSGQDRITSKLDLVPTRSPSSPNNYAVAAFNEYGTRAKVIRPKRAKALRWVQGGRVHFAKVVRQPARPAKPWWAPTVKRWPQAIRRAWRSG